MSGSCWYYICICTLLVLDYSCLCCGLWFCQTRLARGASLRVSIGDIADLLELSPREIEELRKLHNDPKPREVIGGMLSDGLRI